MKSAPADFLAIVGPTAVGKTTVSLEVAEAIGSEIISMDSRQVYLGMDIGTAKATPAERARVPHHGLDLIPPDQSYSAGAFARDARRWIRNIADRGGVPLLVGGTGFFLRALLEPLFHEPPLSAAAVGRLRDYLMGLPEETLVAWTRALDSERFELARAGGPHRMTRALEVALLTGRPLGWWHAHSPASEPAMTGIVVVLERETAALDERIRRRIDRMIEEGLVDEVRALLDRGYSSADPGMTGVGYREIIAHLSGECSLEDSVEAIRRASRQFARRQRTWFRNQLPDRGVIRLDAELPASRLVDEIVRVWIEGVEGEDGPVTQGEPA